MRYSIQNNGQDTVLIRVYAPSGLAGAFLAFIEQKSRENVPKIKTVSPSKDDDYFIKLKRHTFILFDSFINEGLPVKTALSKTNYALKALGFANTSYDNIKQLLSKSGRLRQKSTN